MGVMSDTLERQLSTWEARSPVPSPSFSGILKALTKLHEAVSGILPPNQVRKADSLAFLPSCMPHIFRC